MTVDHSWRVSLEVPAETRHLHIVRLTAAGAAAEVGLSTDEVEDVKIAIDELCSSFIDAADDTETIGLRFEASGSSLVIEADGPIGGTLEVDDLTRTILDATLDDLVVGPDGPNGGFRLTKHHSGH